MSDAASILSRLVGVEGITEREGPIVAAAADLCRELGLEPEVHPEGVVLRVDGANEGPSVLFCSHLDTVPAGDGWTFPPFQATSDGGFLYGRGAADARASCAAIIFAARHFAQAGLPRGRFIGALSLGEEGNDPSLPRLLEKIGPVDAAVVGEPTQMDIANRQRGLLVLELTARGEQAHAARGRGANSIATLARDLVALAEAQATARHEILTQVKITPTRLSAGVADNVIPPRATALLDVRTASEDAHRQIKKILRGLLIADARVVADAWPPCETPLAHPLVAAARSALPKAKVFASDTTSDWVFLAARGIPALKIGPGDMSYAHAPNERIALADIESGAAGYIRLAESMLSPPSPRNGR